MWRYDNNDRLSIIYQMPASVMSMQFVSLSDFKPGISRATSCTMTSVTAMPVLIPCWYKSISVWNVPCSSERKFWRNARMCLDVAGQIWVSMRPNKMITLYRGLFVFSPSSGWSLGDRGRFFCKRLLLVRGLTCTLSSCHTSIGLPWGRVHSKAFSYGLITETSERSLLWASSCGCDWARRIFCCEWTGGILTTSWWRLCDFWHLSLGRSMGKFVNSSCVVSPSWNPGDCIFSENHFTVFKVYFNIFLLNTPYLKE